MAQFNNRLNQNIKALRTESQLTINELAEQLGMEPQTLTDIENDRMNISHDTALKDKAAKIFGKTSKEMSLAQFF